MKLNTQYLEFKFFFELSHKSVTALKIISPHKITTNVEIYKFCREELWFGS